MSGGWRRFGHLLVLALILPLALSGALPVFARALEGPAVHVCHCEIRGGHSSCACPICHPDRDDLRLTEASFRGRCGADDPAFGATLGSSVLPSPGVTVLRPNVAWETRRRVSPRIDQVFLTPPTPPPRLVVA